MHTPATTETPGREVRFAAGIVSGASLNFGEAHDMQKSMRND